MLSAARYQTTQQKINNTRQRIANGNVRDMEVWELIWELQPHFHPSLSLFVQLFSDDTAVKDTHVIRLAQSIFTKSHHIEHKTISGYWDLIAIFVQKRSFLHVDYPDLFHDIIVSFRRYIESHPNPRKSFEFTCERLEPWMLADIRLQGVVSLIVFNQAFDYTSVLQQISNGINPAAIGYQKLLFERIRHLNSMLFNNSAPLPEYQCKKLVSMLPPCKSQNYIDIANVYRLYLQAYGAGKSSKNCVGQFLFYLQLFDAIWSIEAMTMNSKLELVGALHGLLIEHNVIIPSILQHEKLFESHWSSFVDTALKYYSDSQSSARGSFQSGEQSILMTKTT
jgi:hypothetical protein